MEDDGNIIKHHFRFFINKVIEYGTSTIVMINIGYKIRNLLLFQLGSGGPDCAVMSSFFLL